MLIKGLGVFFGVFSFFIACALAIAYCSGLKFGESSFGFVIAMGVLFGGIIGGGLTAAAIEAGLLER